MTTMLTLKLTTKRKSLVKGFFLLFFDISIEIINSLCYYNDVEKSKNEFREELSMSTRSMIGLEYPDGKIKAI